MGGKALGKNQKIAIGVGGAGIAYYLYYRNKQAAAAAAAVPAPSDQVSPTDTTAQGLSSDTGPGVYGAQGTAASNTVVGSVSTNQDWYSTALSAVEDAGYDAGTAAAALSAYLGHQQLTTAQQTIVRIGLAAAGNPPVGSFTIITTPTPVPTPTPTPTPAPTPAPVDVAPKTPANLRLLDVTPTTISLGWNTSTSGAYQYHLYQGASRVATVFGTFSGVSGKHPGTKYGPFTVRAVSRGGKESAPSNAVYVTTKLK
jgi:hypothetical protein